MRGRRAWALAAAAAAATAATAVAAAVLVGAAAPPRVGRGALDGVGLADGVTPAARQARADGLTVEVARGGAGADGDAAGGGCGAGCGTGAPTAVAPFTGGGRLVAALFNTPLRLTNGWWPETGALTRVGGCGRRDEVELTAPSGGAAAALDGGRWVIEEAPGGRDGDVYLRSACGFGRRGGGGGDGAAGAPLYLVRSGLFDGAAWLPTRRVILARLRDDARLLHQRWTLGRRDGAGGAGGCVTLTSRWAEQTGALTRAGFALVGGGHEPDRGVNLHETQTSWWSQCWSLG